MAHIGIYFRRVDHCLVLFTISLVNGGENVDRWAKQLTAAADNLQKPWKAA